MVRCDNLEILDGYLTQHQDSHLKIIRYSQERICAVIMDLGTSSYNFMFTINWLYFFKSKMTFFCAVWTEFLI